MYVKICPICKKDSYSSNCKSKYSKWIYLYCEKDISNMIATAQG